MPGSPKMISTTMVPPMSAPMLSPATVSNVRLDGRSAWRQSTRRFVIPFDFGHEDEVLLQRRDHVAAQQAHVGRDLRRPPG